MKFKIFTLFPKMIDDYFSYSIPKKSIEKGKVVYQVINIRDYSSLSYNQVDDYEFGGDSGMLLRADILGKALEANLSKDDFVIYLSPQGTVLNQQFVENFKHKNIALICGHYKGIDQRVIDKYVHMELSIGDYILSGGELGAMVFMDSIIRLQDGVIGSIESANSDSISDNYLLDTPRYTRPNSCFCSEVPDVLKSGNHSEIKKWQLKNKIRTTRIKREDLYIKYLTKENK